MPGRTSPFQTSVSGMSDGSDSYRYGFNGKENDFEPKNGQGTQQDYGMRIYDPRLGKFLSVDPITKQYPELTPYQFASNMPINSIDLDGEESKIAIYAAVNLKIKRGYLLHADNVEFKAGAGRLIQLHNLPRGGVFNFYLYENRVEGSYTYIDPETKESTSIVFGPQETQDNLAAATKEKEAGEAALQNFVDFGHEGLGAPRNPRNPNGRNGGLKHQNVISKIKANILKAGNLFKTEKKVKTTGQNKNSRFMDVAEYDANGNLIKYHQVGKQNKDGTPVSRERKAIEDVKNSGDNTPIEYHPYNKEE